MQYFWDWAVKPLLNEFRISNLIEIGASLGGNTERMLGSFPNLSITVIDPCLDEDLSKKFKHDKRVTIIKNRSLDALPEINGNFDAILIDGDHNYYTVYNELKSIFDNNLLRRNGIILFHDVGEPYARKDMYYEPHIIPESAKSEHSPHGVLTAIEDFVAESAEEFTWYSWKDEHGLGCLVYNRSNYLKYILPLKLLGWQGIRWKNRLLRLFNIKEKDTISWGKRND